MLQHGQARNLPRDLQKRGIPMLYNVYVIDQFFMKEGATKSSFASEPWIVTIEIQQGK